MKSTNGTTPLKAEPPRWSTIPATTSEAILNLINVTMVEFDLSFEQTARVLELAMQKDMLNHTVHQYDRTDEMVAAIGERVEGLGSTISTCLDDLRGAIEDRD